MAAGQLPGFLCRAVEGQPVEQPACIFITEVSSCWTIMMRVLTMVLLKERRLYMYVKYCENKPKSEYIVAEYIDYFEVWTA